MTLAEQLFYMMQQNQSAMQLTDMLVGTVSSVTPLEITISTEMAPLRKEVLLLTENVIEKKLPVLEHTHSITGLNHYHVADGSVTTKALSDEYSTSAALAELSVTENGISLPIENGYIILNRGLVTGDRVILLRVQHGQKFVVLSRIFDFEVV